MLKFPSTINECVDFIIRAFTIQKIVGATLMFSGIAGMFLSYRLGCHLSRFNLPFGAPEHRREMKTSVPY